MISYWLWCGAVQPQSNTAERFPGNHKVPEQATMVSTLLKVTWLHMTFSGWIQPKAHRMADKGYQPWSPKQPIGSLDLSVRPLPPWSHASSGALKVKDAETRCTSPRTFFRSFCSISLVLQRFCQQDQQALLFQADLFWVLIPKLNQLYYKLASLFYNPSLRHWMDKSSDWDQRVSPKQLEPAQLGLYSLYSWAASYS